MEDNFWIKFYGLIAIIFIGLFLTITIISVHSDRVIAEAIKNGGNPIAVSCAISNSGSNRTMCNIYTAGLNFSQEKK